MITPLTRVTLKAFLAAVCALEESLPDAVQAEIRTVGQTGEYGRLDAIARNCPQLTPTYIQARKALNRPSQERNKGGDFPPDDTPDPLNTETDNLARNIDNLKDMQELLDAIEREMRGTEADGPEVPEKIERILGAEDCFAIARELFPYRPLA
ncbi:hypothetical protein J0895_09305 [Phormidium pseudopriestleyi FRX01]|uniref:Uncharacterized protein n=1 Tax=Phormidium pseudopriestleyi FRX01 TaxID=1759528 RepID=A0ABS3FQP2_9CYAN|nr:hypothetical protein [Phormidium pseudopriestleyi]MBO0349299.1 hypothetical protein [Phormidium pseudopriestleyi FRX01]